MNLYLKIILKIILAFVLLSIVSCSESGRERISNYKVGDSLFVTDQLRLTIASRQHYTNSSGFVDGHAQVDSNKIDMCLFSNLHREFFFDRESTFIGTYKEVCKYDSDYIVLELSDDIKKMIKKDSDCFGEKIQLNKKDFYSGKISKGVTLENFPDEVYIDADNLSNVNADSVFNVLK